MADWLTTIFQQNVNAVYDASGDQIGYFVDLPTLASGHVMLFQGKSLADPWNWQIKSEFLDFTFGQLVNAGQYLVQKGYSPAWMTPAEVAAMKGQSGAAGIPDAAAAAADTVGQAIQAPLSLARSPPDWNKLALYGGAGLVGVILLSKVLNKALA